MNSSNVYELRAHFDSCATCRAATMGESFNLAQLCFVGGQLVKTYAHQVQRQMARPGQRRPWPAA